MNKTKIEWVKNPDDSQGYTLNSKTGCLNHTPEGLCLGSLFPCYAYKLANGRLRERYLANHNYIGQDTGYSLDDVHNLAGIIDPADNPFYPRFWPERLKEPYRIKKPTGLFLDDMSDWMGDYWPREWTEAELQMMRDNPQHRIYTLTKQPQNLINFSPFPENCWVGVTATDLIMAYSAAYHLKQIEASVKYISFEPLLDWKSTNGKFFEDTDIDWSIIGAQTNPYKPPRLEWVLEIIEAANKAKVRVFLKNNLVPMIANSLNPDKLRLYPDGIHLMQEMPDV